MIILGYYVDFWNSSDSYVFKPEFPIGVYYKLELLSFP